TRHGKRRGLSHGSQAGRQWPRRRSRSWGAGITARRTTRSWQACGPRATSMKRNMMSDTEDFLDGIEDFLDGLERTVSEVRPTADDLRVWKEFYPGGEIEVSVTLPFAQWAVVIATITAGAFSVPNPGLGKL